jgi:hypothetical protein
VADHPFPQNGPLEVYLAAAQIYHGAAAMAKRITIQLVGSSLDKEDVRLTDLIEQLKIVKKALLENERAITDFPILDYKVVDLRHNSPATFVFEPVSMTGQPPPLAYANQVLTDFSDELGQSSAMAN